MSCTRRDFVTAASGAMLLGLAACSGNDEPEDTIDVTPAEPEDSQPKEPEPEPEEPDVDLREFEKLALDTDAWKYDEENDVYYQLGVPYCLHPASNSYETLAIFVPGPYFVAEESGKMYSCTIDEDTTVGTFSPATAPVLLPINSGNLGPQASPTSYGYTGLGHYLSNGCVYVYAGLRGRSSGYESGSGDVYSGGDPWPVVDLKAVVRFLRYNAEVLPCDLSRIFSFGFSGGGGVSAVLGASGDSELYAAYLEQIGAATHDAEGNPISDQVFGSASWCPITSFDTADASYEWMMGQYFDADTREDGTWTKLLSDDLARSYAGYINELDLRDANGKQLVLDETSGELFTDGSYYNYLLSCVEDAASTFFERTQFPYTYTPQHLVNANFPGDPNLQSMGAGASDVEAVTGDASAQAAGMGYGEGTSSNGMTQVQSVVFNAAGDYVNNLNTDGSWLTYNQRRGSIRITSLGDFVRHLKKAAKGVGAFDAPDRSTVENQLFGVDDAGSLHFSQMLRDQLEEGRDRYAKADDWDDGYIEDWDADLAELDCVESDMATRMNMFNPLYFLSEYYEGSGTSAVAPHWRINSGIFQTDTSLCTEVNLALVLQQCDLVSDVAFNPVWGQGHVLAEVSGTAEENLLDWVISCCKDD